MSKMKIKRVVTIKAKLTETLQKKMIAELQEVIARLDRDIALIEEKMTKFVGELTKNNPTQAVVVRQQLTLEKEQIMKNKETVLDKVRAVSKMELGLEVTRGTVEGMVEVKIGDNLDELMFAEILVEDGKVLEFR